MCICARFALYVFIVPNRRGLGPDCIAFLKQKIAFAFAYLFCLADTCVAPSVRRTCVRDVEPCSTESKRFHELQHLSPRQRMGHEVCHVVVPRDLFQR